MRCVLAGFYTVDQNQRAVKTVFGRAQRLGNLTTSDDPISESLRDDEAAASVDRAASITGGGASVAGWKAAAVPGIRFSPHGFAIDHPDPEIGD